MTAGSINGDTENGSYVGGLAGCNASTLMLQDTNGTAKKLYVSTQNISGKYFVGGVIGANIINTNGYSQNMVTEPGQSGSSDTATDSSAGNTTKLCYVTLQRTTVWGDATAPNAQYDFNVVNNSDQEMKNWYLKIHLIKGAVTGEQFNNVSVTKDYEYSATEKIYK